MVAHNCTWETWERESRGASLGCRGWAPVGGKRSPWLPWSWLCLWYCCYVPWSLLLFKQLFPDDDVQLWLFLKWLWLALEFIAPVCHPEQCVSILELPGDHQRLRENEERQAASTSRNDNLLLIDSAQDAVSFSEIFSFSNCMNGYFADTWWSLKWQRQPMLSR